MILYGKIICHLNGELKWPDFKIKNKILQIDKKKKNYQNYN